jgi:hypothetical protein
MTTTLNSYRFLSSATAASASASYITDWRFPTEVKRTVFGRLDGGASVRLYVYGHPTDETIPVLTSTFTTSSFLATLDGPVAKIRVEKVGASGAAYVEGLV